MSGQADEIAEVLAAVEGVRAPDRRRRVTADGIDLAVIEWGAEDAPPLMLAHGGFDFAATFSRFGPLLAEGGYRVVAWDQRGHGDSAWAFSSTWDSDLRDAVAVIRSTSDRPAVFVGHSKGGGLLTTLAGCRPDLCSALVNLDGLPSKRPHPDVADHERTRMLADDLAGWLDHRRRARELERRPGTLDELAARRGRMNPRLPMEWLRFLVTVGARHDSEGWRWKLDPALRFGGFGPWRPEWMLYRLAGVTPPFLGVLGLVQEEMGWGTTPEDLEGRLPPGGRLVTLPDTGHFVHIERPVEVAGLVLEFLGEVL